MQTQWLEMNWEFSVVTTCGVEIKILQCPGQSLTMNCAVQSAKNVPGWDTLTKTRLEMESMMSVKNRCRIHVCGIKGTSVRRRFACLEAWLSPEERGLASPLSVFRKGLPPLACCICMWEAIVLTTAFQCQFIGEGLVYIIMSSI